MKRRPRLDHKQMWVDHYTIGFGMTLYVYWNRTTASPLGFVWGFSQSSGKNASFDVFGSYVEPMCRRQGVRTKINEEIFKQHEVIKSWAGTKTGGLAFLKGSGYKFNKEARQWIKEKKK